MPHDAAPPSVVLDPSSQIRYSFVMTSRPPREPGLDERGQLVGQMDIYECLNEAEPEPEPEPPRISLHERIIKEAVAERLRLTGKGEQ